MAKHIITQFIDDLDGSTDDVETVTIGYSGVTYEIDLAKGNRAKLDQSLQPFLDVARSSAKAKVRRSTAKAASASNVPSAPNAKAVRIWAAENGITVPTRGRIPGAIIEQYRAAGR